MSAAALQLAAFPFSGSIPHVAILDKDGKPLYDQAGEVEESELDSILERALK